VYVAVLELLMEWQMSLLERGVLPATLQRLHLAGRSVRAMS
jgi:hypothetical protein